MAPESTNAPGVRRVTLNTMASFVQAVATAGVLFWIYDFVLDRVGLADFGVWAVVASAATTASLGNMGLSSAALKYVAQYTARGQGDRAARVVLTSLVAVAGIVGVLALLAYLLLPFVLEWVLQSPAERDLALKLLPLSLISFWVLSIGGIPAAALDGYNRVDQRVWATLSGVAAYLAGVMFWVPRVGVMGLVLGQVAQGAVTALVAWILVRRVSGRLPILPVGFDPAILRELTGYGVSFQAISITQILFEPTAKAVLAWFGGSAATGLFELANRLIVQLRSLINSSHQALLPYIAHLNENDPDRVALIYKQSVRVMSLIALSTIPLAILAAPLISIFWLQGLDAQFLVYVVILACAWLGNLMANPAYYSNAGVGTLHWNLMGHLVIALANPLLGIAMGFIWGPIGVVAGFGLALLLGSGVTAVEYGRRTGGGLFSLLGGHDAWLAAVAVAASILGLAQSTSVYVWGGAWALGGYLALLFLMGPLPATLRHPEFRWLLGRMAGSGTDVAGNRTQHSLPPGP